MPRVEKSVLVPFDAGEMYALVDGVEDYPRFLPWCGGATVLSAGPEGRTARLDIDYHGIKTHFTTVNRNDPPRMITIALKDGPFRELRGEWRFRALAPKACKVEFNLAYEFSTPILGRIIGPVFNHIANTFIDAFVRRAETVYAKAR
jgi:ribosome-associated toxin RatA of RatAB toxin-antitoxin module